MTSPCVYFRKIIKGGYYLYPVQFLFWHCGDIDMSKKGYFTKDLFQGLGILQGWKEIGRHIGRSGRTARRWYDKQKMPVRYNLAGRPFAFIYEIDKWMLIVDELLRKKPDWKEKQKQHAAMMRARKEEKRKQDAN